MVALQAAEPRQAAAGDRQRVISVSGPLAESVSDYITGGTPMRSLDSTMNRHKHWPRATRPDP